MSIEYSSPGGEILAGARYLTGLCIMDLRTQFVASQLWNDDLILGFLLPMSQLSLMRAMSLVSFFESFFKYRSKD